MITWGVVGNSHDASLAVFETKRRGLGPNRSKTELLWASLSKDFSGVPNDPDFNQEQEARPRLNSLREQEGLKYV